MRPHKHTTDDPFGSAFGTEHVHIVGMDMLGHHHRNWKVGEVAYWNKNSQMLPNWAVWDDPPWEEPGSWIWVRRTQ